MNGKYRVAAYSLSDTRFTLLTAYVVFSLMVVFSVAVCAKHHAFRTSNKIMVLLKAQSTSRDTLAFWLMV